eukprot:6342266-Amphidinium_carterae.1
MLSIGNDIDVCPNGSVAVRLGAFNAEMSPCPAHLAILNSLGSTNGNTHRPIQLVNVMGE